MEKLVVRHRDGSVELAEVHSLEEALLRLAEYEGTPLPPAASFLRQKRLTKYQTVVV